MSEAHEHPAAEAPAADPVIIERRVAEHPVAEHTIDHIHDTVVEHDDGGPSWWVRLILGVGGIVLLLAALGAWQFQDSFHGSLGMALPWFVAGAIILGAAAIVESITTEVWVTIIAGFFLLAIAYIVTGRVTVALDQVQHTAFIVDRFTGQVRACTAVGCRELPGFGGPSVSLPSAPAPKKTGI